MVLKKITKDTKPIKAATAPYLICDNCGNSALIPMHGHFLCQVCKLPTKCCEGSPAEL